MVNWFRKNSMMLAVTALATGFISTIVGLFGVIIPEHAPSFVGGALDRIGNWGYWLFFIGLLLLAGGIWQIWSEISNQRKFERLMLVDSKAKFIRDQDELEYLAWSLGKDYKERVEKRKKDLRIK